MESAPDAIPAPVAVQSEENPTESREEVKKRRAAIQDLVKTHVVYEDSIGSTSTVAEHVPFPTWCPCFRKKRVDPEPAYEVIPPASKRSDYTLQFVIDAYKRINNNAEVFSDGWQNPLQGDLLSAFKHIIRAIRHLHLINKFLEENLQILSHYLENDVTAEELEMVESRCTIGSYMWLLGLILDKMLDEESMKLDPTYFPQILVDLAKLSSKSWVRLSELVESFIKARKKAESTIDKYIHCHDLEGLTHETVLSDKKRRQSIQSVKQHQTRESKLNRLKRYHKTYRPPSGVMNPPHSNVTNKSKCLSDYQVLKKKVEANKDKFNTRKETEQWQYFGTRGNMEAQETDMKALSRLIKRKYEEIYLNIYFADKYMNRCKDVQARGSAISFYEAILFLRRTLRSLPRMNQHILFKREDRVALVESGRILEDELHLTEYFLMSLRNLVFEGRFTVHVVYELCRMRFNCEIPLYEIATNVGGHGFFEQSENLNFINRRSSKSLEQLAGTDELVMNYETVLKEFKTSSYFELLKIFPVTVEGNQFTISRHLGPSFNADLATSSSSTSQAASSQPSEEIPK